MSSVLVKAAVFFALLVSAAVVGADTLGAQTPEASELDAAALTRVQAIFSNEAARLKRLDDYGLRVVDLASGRLVYEKNGAKPLVPASNTKVFTAAAALAVLGLDYRFRTVFAGTAPVKDGVIAGDLVVVAAGDPTINDDFVEAGAMNGMLALAQRLVDRGLRKVEGGLVADTSRFRGPSIGDSWPKEPYWKTWMVEVSPLVFNDNQVGFITKGGAASPTVRVSPDLGFVTVATRLAQVEASRSEVIDVTRGADGRSFTLTGKVWRKSPGHEIRANVGDGTGYFLAALRSALEKKGVAFGGPNRISPDKIAVADADVLVTYESNLRDVLGPMLKSSNNLYAEQIFRVLGHEKRGDGSFRGGFAAIYDWLVARKIAEPGVELKDGSGLSRANRASAKQMTNVLAEMWRDEKTREVFRNMLAEPGKTGTLHRRLLDLEGCLFAKTGTLSGVSTLSGYVRSKRGRWLAFAFLFNESRGAARQAQDRMVHTLAAAAL